LAAARSRGVPLGVKGWANLRSNVEHRQWVANEFVGRLQGVFNGMRARKLSQRAMVAELNEARIAAPRGGVWTLVQVQRALHRLSATPSFPAASKSDRVRTTACAAGRRVTSV
jgi:hypothetical protein